MQRAVSAIYNKRKRELVVEFEVGMRLVVPLDILQGFADLPPAALTKIEVTAGGTNLHWPDLDKDLWVRGLLEGLVGNKTWIDAMRSNTDGAPR